MDNTKLVLTKREAKALRTLLNYCAYDECENYGGEKDHIWLSIRPLYALVFGNHATLELENTFIDEEN
jgi:hypothetical protein